MPATINGQTYYRTAEACRMAGISKNTPFRWLKNGIFNEPAHRDKRGWRLFTEDEVNRLKISTRLARIRTAKGRVGCDR